MKQEMQSEVSKKIKKIKRKISEKASAASKKESEKKSNYRSNPYSKKEKEDQKKPAMDTLNLLSASGKQDRPKTSARNVAPSPRQTPGTGAGKEVLFEN
jgi:hypothetical protein